ncbi:MAG: DNA helicase PriA [Methanoregulaceae archaeon]|nr:DNA helicase PriA [Methanoregulaceae archaeon]
MLRHECGYELDLRCRQCGAHLLHEPRLGIFCPSCGRRVTLVCHRCGKKW